jgi:signal peptidase I
VKSAIVNRAFPWPWHPTKGASVREGLLAAIIIKLMRYQRVIVLSLLIVFLSCNRTERVFTLPNNSMEPTIKRGEKLVVDMRAFQPQRGDLVVCEQGGDLLVKRVIGIAGDVVEGHDLKVTVNGRLLNEPYVQHVRNRPLDPETLENFGPITVSAGQFFVAGDNRDYSFDSRDPRFGLVATTEVKGRPLRIVDSPDPARRGLSLK